MTEAPLETPQDQTLTCPGCGSEQVRRSHRRGGFEQWIGRFLKRDPWRCEPCGARFFRQRQEGVEYKRVDIKEVNSLVSSSTVKARTGSFAGRTNLRMLWAAGICVALLIGAAVAFEIKGLRERSKPSAAQVAPVRRVIRRGPGLAIGPDAGLPFSSSYDGHIAPTRRLPLPVKPPPTPEKR